MAFGGTAGRRIQAITQAIIHKYTVLKVLSQVLFKNEQFFSRNLVLIVVREQLLKVVSQHIF